MTPSPLAGRRILVTRPLDQAAALARLIRASGGEPIVFPAIDIGPPVDPAALARTLAGLAAFDIAIFVSPAAVEYGFRAIDAAGGWPAGLRAATVGPATAQSVALRLARRGVTEIIAPVDRFDSEGLLAVPALAQVAGLKIMIFRGGAGRELLGATLVERGATVEYAACYERQPPRADPGPLLERWAREGIDAASFTSSEGLANFAAVIGRDGRALLTATPLFVPHARIAERAQALGAEAVILTAAGDAALVAALEGYLR